MDNNFFNSDEKTKLRGLYRELCLALDGGIDHIERRRIRSLLADAAASGALSRDRFGFNPLLSAMSTALALCRSVDADRNMVLAILLTRARRSGVVSEEKLADDWGADVAHLVRGIDKVTGLYTRNASVESDNFRKLLLTFAEDIRVIIIMIVNRLSLMRAINHHPAENLVRETAYEVNYLYAPLAHRLGLYAIKSELEDLSLKYSNRDVYSRIAHELNETKAKRDQYIAEFIAPIKKKLEDEGLNFEIKGRTKSIYSIWNKMK
ncbi:MAG: HD domain-containing protein, partial [Muribaculaceae bacterium]|nr:HD domain-containing protein [Muribaculaceae bacterium]